MDLIKINNVAYDKIVNYSQSFEQLWRDGSGRSPYTGVWNGQILGNFNPIKLSLYIDDKNVLSRLVKDLKSGSIQVSHYDIETMKTKTVTFYRANFEVKILKFLNGGIEQKFEVIDIEFIPHRPS